jgi:thiamine pyrophosphokinase
VEKNTIFVISGGPLEDLTFLHAQLALFEPAETVCADGGTRHLDALGLVPQVIIGDRDSLAPELLKRCEERGSRIIPYPADKDKTDTWLALEYALDRRPAQILIFGALGGRFDHALANVSLLAMAARGGARVRILDEWCELFTVGGEGPDGGGGVVAVDGEEGQTISLLPLTTEVTGIRLAGFAYPLKDARMEIGRPYGTSNRLAAKQGIISVASGILLAIRYFRVGVFPGGGVA